MDKEDFATGAEATWCPGCHNFMILESVKKALKGEVEEGNVEHDKISMSTGIGCHGKMFDYLNVGGVYSLHGRVLPTCMGMKIGNPSQTVIGFGGDGDTYSEGVAHFIHASRFNADMTMVVHNNQVFALTTGQATPVSEKGFESKAQPFGLEHEPLNPLKIAISAGASFVARVYPKKMEHMVEVLKEAIEWDGFALVDVALPCLVYHDPEQFLEERMYKLEDTDHNPEDREEAMEKAREWDYNLEDGKIPVGVLYKNRKPTLSDKNPQLKELKEGDRGWWKVER
ncbi:MAG: thiamine pyrophosphate-dependent enzyme [Candidatus Aenigmatarchaeota archaeon]